MQNNNNLWFAAFLFFHFPSYAMAKDAEVILLKSDETATVRISMRGTILSFPVRPTKVILGKANSFGIEYSDADLAISPLSPNSRSNFFVYVYGRRFSFDLVTAQGEASAVVLVRDALEKPLPQALRKVTHE